MAHDDFPVYRLIKASLLILTVLFTAPQNSFSQSEKNEISITSQKIWDSGNHNAFTDLIRYKRHFYCVFREADGHVPRNKDENGKIRIIRSRKGKKWESVGLLESEVYDLRDPKISEMPDGRLLIVMGGSDYDGRKLRSRLCHVSFSSDGKVFSDIQPVNIDPSIRTNVDWLWRVSWIKGTGYGVVYQPDEESWKIILVSSPDGVNYSFVSNLDIEGKPNESTVRFSGDKMYMIVRREAGVNGLLGNSLPPYSDWEWKDLGMRLGGPDLLMLKNGNLLFASRKYPEPGEQSAHKTIMVQLDDEGRELKRFTFPSGGDTSYPGMVLFRNKLWVTYYSSHEGKTSIYLATMHASQL